MIWAIDKLLGQELNKKYKNKEQLSNKKEIVKSIKTSS